MAGFIVDLEELLQAARSAAQFQEQLTGHPAARWGLERPSEVGNQTLAEALSRFQAASQHAIGVVGSDWGEAAARLTDAAEHYRVADKQQTRAMRDLAARLGTSRGADDT